MTAALCRKRPSPVVSGQPRTWACSIIYALLAWRTSAPSLGLARAPPLVKPEQNDEWAVSRRYMSLESLSALSDDPLLRLSAVAA